jgi:hypothetical protein
MFLKKINICYTHSSSKWVALHPLSRCKAKDWRIKNSFIARENPRPWTFKRSPCDFQQQSIARQQRGIVAFWLDDLFATVEKLNSLNQVSGPGIAEIWQGPRETIENTCSVGASPALKKVNMAMAPKLP